MSQSREAGKAPRRFAPALPVIRPTIRHLLALYLLLASLFSFVIPPFEAPDEIWHFAFVQHLVTQRTLPVAEPNTRALWRQQGTQAPAYYAGAALLTALIDQSDFPELFARANPHRAIGQPDTAINRNYLIHHRQTERFPWRRSILALHVVRLFSVFLGAVTVYAVYRTLHLLLPPQNALLGAAFAAFLPQFAFISASVSNDNAVNAAAALVLWQLTEMLVEGGPPQRSRLLKLGAALGLALLSKLSGLGLVGVSAAAILWLAWRIRNLRPIFDAALWTAVPAILLAGWWYLRNWRLYGDPLAWEMWEANILLRVIPAGPSQILSELGGLERSFWGLFGWLNLPYPAWVYLALRVVAAVVAFGLLFHLARETRTGDARSATRFSPRVPHAFLILWLLFLTISWLRFMRVAPAAQGRYFFAALPALALLWTFGWTGWGSRFGHGIGWSVTSALGLLTLATPFFLIQPAYRLPPMSVPDSGTNTVISPTPRSLFLAGNSEIQLQHAAALYDGQQEQASATDPRIPTVFPGDEVQVDLAYLTNAPLTDDWSLFIHLVDGTGLTVAQLDTMPGGGLRPTSGWQPGRLLLDSYTVAIPETAHTPNRAGWQVGFYDHRSGERLPQVDGGTGYTFGEVTICPTGFTVADCQPGGKADVAQDGGHSIPIPLHVQFDDNITLAGYSFNTRTPVPGEEMTVILYWTASGQVVELYTVFAHLLTDSFEMFGGADLQPSPPTETWTAGETVATVHTFTVPSNAPPGLYQIEIGLYTRPDFQRLRILDRISPAQEDRMLLGPLRIE
ncbi:MAG: DUF2142 domain-containing protein [Caldilineaceae bacterium]|nr:DUF2142 domain-containing protein [Caldilineaceae bacterium]